MRISLLFPADGGRLCDSWFCRAVVPAFAGRPALKPFVFIVWTGVCEAPAAGVVRAITERFSTELGGRLTLPLALAAPSALCLVGEKPALLVTCALRSEASSI
jgi:hypothetical protein